MVEIKNNELFNRGYQPIKVIQKPQPGSCQGGYQPNETSGVKINNNPPTGSDAKDA